MGWVGELNGHSMFYVGIDMNSQYINNCQNKSEKIPQYLVHGEIATLTAFFTKISQKFVKLYRIGLIANLWALTFHMVNGNNFWLSFCQVLKNFDKSRLWRKFNEIKMNLRFMQNLSEGGLHRIKYLRLIIIKYYHH